MKTQISHDTFTIERTFSSDRFRTFQAWANADQKAKWFVGPAGRWIAIRREMNFSKGGEEIVVGRFEDHGTSGFFCTYQDIVDQERIVYSYRMFVDEELLSISLVTVQFKDEGAGCKTIFTEQGVYFGDPTAAKNRLVGSQMLMDNFVDSLNQE
jgi:uncharacterized protein YndB with AHSA1/START domain